MRAAADAFGAGTRRDATLRMLATEAAAHLAWDVAVEALAAIAAERRTSADVIAARDRARARRQDRRRARSSIEDATASGRFDDGGALLAELRAEVERKAELARALEVQGAHGARARCPRDARRGRRAVGRDRRIRPEPPSDSGPIQHAAGPSRVRA